jgi:7,8-dihydropterin-6-yl-methyl-4-(beta-D-ribofuranosyl)aminobenzene 5'-phosphate synthase
MKLTIVYDNDVYKNQAGVRADWGFSCLIETKDDTVLFDTGAQGDILLSNLEKLGVDPSCITKIVLSHEHWDHTGGLEALVPFVGEVELYRLGSQRPSSSMRLISSEQPQEISQKIYSTGRVTGVIDEQSLILQSEKGWYVLVGCSHPGVKTILSVASTRGEIVGLVGGLHGFQEFSLLEKLQLVCPTHCTQYKTQIHQHFPQRAVKGGVGRTFEL